MSFFQFTAEDIQLDADGDLLIENGDFVVRPSDGIHVKHLIESAKGNWRFKPLTGLDITRFTNAVGNKTEIKQDLKEELENDGYIVQGINVQPNAIDVKAKRIK